MGSFPSLNIGAARLTIVAVLAVLLLLLLLLFSLPFSGALASPAFEALSYHLSTPTPGPSIAPESDAPPTPTSEPSSKTPDRSSATPDPSPDAPLTPTSEPSSKTPDRSSATPDPSPDAPLTPTSELSSKTPDRSSATPDPSPDAPLTPTSEPSSKTPDRSSATPEPSPTATPVRLDPETVDDIMAGGAEGADALAGAAGTNPEEAADALTRAAGEDAQAAGATLAAAARDLDPDAVNDLGKMLAAAGSADAAGAGATLAAAARDLDPDAVVDMGKMLAAAGSADAAGAGATLAAAARDLDPDAVVDMGKMLAAAGSADAAGAGATLAAAADAVAALDEKEADPEAVERLGSVVAAAGRADAPAAGAVISQAARSAVAAARQVTVGEVDEAAAVGNLANAMIAAGRADAAGASAAMGAGPAQDPEALSAIGELLTADIWVPDVSPQPGPDPAEGVWQSVGSPAPIEQILAKYARTFPDAKVVVADVLELPPGVPPLPPGRKLNSLLSFTPEGFGDEEVITAHATLFVEKSWLDANQVHQWSVQFSRFDEEQSAWRPTPARRLREDQERVYFSVVIPGFSLWAISGSEDVPPPQFRVADLIVTPGQVVEGQPVTVQVQVTNLTTEAADFNIAIWLNSRVHATQSVAVDVDDTIPASFILQPKVGSFEVRIDRLMGSFTVQAKPTPTPTPTPSAVPTPTPPPPTVTPTPSPIIAVPPTPEATVLTPTPTSTATPSPTATPVPAPVDMPPTATPKTVAAEPAEATATPAPAPTGGFCTVSLDAPVTAGVLNVLLLLAPLGMIAGFRRYHSSHIRPV